MSEPKFKPGDKVCFVGESQKTGMIDEIGKRFSGIQYYKVFWGGVEGTTTQPEGNLRLLREDSSPIQDLIDGNVSNYQSFLRRITREKLSRSQPLRNNIYAFNASRTRFYPYQFKPLMKLLDSTTQRLLVCDEVGLGKTIEAGLILTELQARQDVRRVLVVCPSNLRFKWKMELKKRFGEDFRILRSQGFREFLDEFQEDFQSVRLKGIISIESLRGDKMFEQLESVSPSFDLVIVDEAHHMRNMGTKNRRAGKILSELSSSMICLTATPVHLGEHNLYSLLNILDSDEFKDEHTVMNRLEENRPVVRVQTILSYVPPDFEKAYQEFSNAVEVEAWLETHPYSRLILETLEKRVGVSEEGDYREDLLKLQRWLAELNLLSHIFTRTRKREVHHEVALREAHAVRVEFNEEEKRFYDAVTRYVQAWSEANDDHPVIRAWRLNTPQRRMSSSIHAMVEHYGALLGASSDKIRKSLVEEEFEDMESYGLENDDELVSEEAPVRHALYLDLPDAQRALKELIEQWPQNTDDTKYRNFRDELIRLRKMGPLRVVVFAFFKATLRYLLRRLEEDGISAVMVSGDVEIEERAALIERIIPG